jgi:hypothetical protein
MSGGLGIRAMSGRPFSKVCLQVIQRALVGIAGEPQLLCQIFQLGRREIPRHGRRVRACEEGRIITFPVGRDSRQTGWTTGETLGLQKRRYRRDEHRLAANRDSRMLGHNRASAEQACEKQGLRQDRMHANEAASFTQEEDLFSRVPMRSKRPKR